MLVARTARTAPGSATSDFKECVSPVANHSAAMMAGRKARMPKPKSGAAMSEMRSSAGKSRATEDLILGKAREIGKAA